MPLREDALQVVHKLDEDLKDPRVISSVELDDRLHDRAEYPIDKFEGGLSKSPREAVDINGFFDLVQQVITFKLERDSWNKRLIFTEDFPEKDDDLDAEIITFGIERRLPGIAEQTPNPLLRNAIRIRKPRFRESTPDRTNHGYSVIQEGLWFDNFVIFTCWARENKIANIRTLWFEDLMREYEWIFRAHGIVTLRYEGRESDVESMVQQRKVVGRPMRYFVRTERIVRTFEKDLESLAIRLHLIDQIEDKKVRRI